MNTRFLRMLADLGWQERIIEPTYNNRGMSNDYVKSFRVGFNGKFDEVPVAVSFWSLDNEEIPGNACIRFVKECQIHPSTTNSRTMLKGRDRIICTLDQAGYMTALKFMIYAFKVGSYKKDGKAIIYNYAI